MKRRLLIALLVVLGLPLTLALLGLGVANTDWGRARLAEAIGWATASQSMRVAVGTIEGTVPTAMVLRDVVVSDTEGVFARVSQARIAWRPLALLSGTMQIDRATVESADIDRAPVTPDDTVQETVDAAPLRLAVPALPFALSIETVAVSEVRLGAPLLGEEAILAAALRFAWDADAVTLAGWVDARRADGGSARLDVDLSIDPRDEVLRAEVRAREPQGGLLADLAGLPDRPAFDLNLNGSGTLAAWRGKLSAGFGLGARLAVDLTVSTDGNATVLRASGDVEPELLLPVDLIPAIGPSVPVLLSVSFRPDGGFDIGELRARVAAGELHGAVTIDAGGVPVAADLLAAVSDASALSAMAGASLDGALDMTARLADEGRHLELSLAGDVRAEDAAVSNIALRGAATATSALALLPESVALTLSGGLDTPSLPEIDLASAVGSRLRVTANGTLAPSSFDARIERWSLTSAGLTLDGTASLSQGRRLDAVADVTIPDLALWRDISGQEIAGAVAGSAEVSLALDPLDVGAVIELALANLDVGDADINRLIGTAPSFGAGLTVDADGTISAPDLWADLAVVTLEGAASVTASGALEGRAAVRLPGLAPIGDVLGIAVVGAGDVALAVGGDVAAPTASASWRLTGTSVDGVPIDRVEGTATAVGLPEAPTGRASATVWAGGEAVIARTDYAVSGDRVRLSNMALEGTGVVAKGALEIDLATPRVDGVITVDAADLGRLGQVFDLPIVAGAGRLDVSLSRTDGQSVSVDGTMDGLQTATGQAVDQARFSARMSDVFNTLSGQGSVDISGLKVSTTVSFDRVAATVESDGTIARATLDGGGMAGAQPLDLEVTADLTTEPRTMAVDRLVARLGDADLILQRPLLVDLGPRPAVRDLALALDGGQISGGGRLDPDDLDVALTANRVPAALVRLIDPAIQLTGGIDGAFRATGPIDDPTVLLSASTEDIRVDDAEFADVPPLIASLSAKIEQRRLSVDGEAAVADGAQASATAVLSLDGSPGEVPSPSMDGPMTARLDADADIAHLAAFLPLDGGRASGKLTLDIDVSGTPSAPVLQGGAALVDGAADIPQVGLYLRDAELDARGQGNRLSIETLSARALAGGTMSGEGWLAFDADQGFPADIRLSARDFVAVSTDDATITVDSDLALTGTRPAHTLAGTITLKPSEIRIPRSLPSSVVSLDVVEVNGPESDDPEPEPAPENAGSLPILLDLTVDIPGQVFVRGRGLDSEWQGQLAVTGSLDDPLVNGAVGVERGSLDALGRLFAFERGRVRFDGGAPDDPALDMRLTTDVAEITAAVVVSGRAQEPTIALESAPAMAEEEILSRILFGSPKAGLSPFQALRLAQSTAIMSGQLGGDGGIAGFADTARNMLGADTLNVESETRADGTTGTSLSVGKYVAPGVFFKLQQGLSGDNSRAVVEVDVTKNVTVETDMGADSQSRVGVNYKLDY